MRIDDGMKCALCALLALALWHCAGTALNGEADGLRTLACGEGHFLWKAEKSGAEAVWLLGSIHLADSSFYPLAPVIDSAFEASTVLAAELDLNEEGTVKKTASLMASEGVLPEGLGLEEVLPEAVFRRLDSASAALGVPVEIFGRFRPWMVALSLSALAVERAGLSGEFGIDVELLARARDLGMKIFPIETPEEQVDIFADGDDSLGVEYLERTLDELSLADSLIPAFAAAWKCGDVRAFRELLGEESSEGVYGERMYADRNAKMARSADSLARSGERVFVVVGAAHLVLQGESVLDRLSALGYRVSRL